MMNQEYWNSYFKERAAEQAFMGAIIAEFEKDTDFRIVDLPDISRYTYVTVKYKSYHAYIEYSLHGIRQSGFKKWVVAEVRVFLPKDKCNTKPRAFITNNDVWDTGREKTIENAIRFLKRDIDTREQYLNSFQDVQD